MHHTHGEAALVPAALVVALVVRRQLRTRPVRRNRSLIGPAVLGVLGTLSLAFGIASVVKYRPLAALPIVLLVTSLAVAAGPGFARARTVRIWHGLQGEVLRKGTAATTGLWLASVAVHFALGLGTQNLVVRGRAAAL